MSTRRPRPLPTTAAPAEAVQRVQTRLAELGRLLAQQQAQVLARLGAVESELGKLGLQSPEAIAQAFAAMDASEREGALRQRARPAADAEALPAVRRKKPRRMV